MPLEHREHFIARVQKNNRVQVPVLIRWKNKLNPGEILRVCVENSKRKYFYARLSRDGRLTIPRIIVEELEVEPGDVLKVALYPEGAR